MPDWCLIDVDPKVFAIRAYMYIQLRIQLQWLVKHIIVVPK